MTFDNFLNYYWSLSRAYSPKIKEWLSVDPLILIDNPVNWFSVRYSNNNPLNLVDPSGQSAEAIGIGWGTALAEPSPVGEVVMGVVTVGYLGYKALNWLSDNLINIFNEDVVSPDTELPELPSNPDELLEEGYEEITHPKEKEKEKENGMRVFENPKTKDKVRWDKGEEGASGFRGKDHYHRYNPNSNSHKDKYLDAVGNTTRKGSKNSHILPK